MAECPGWSGFAYGKRDIHCPGCREHAWCAATRAQLEQEKALLADALCGLADDCQAQEWHLTEPEDLAFARREAHVDCAICGAVKRARAVLPDGKAEHLPCAGCEQL